MNIRDDLVKGLVLVFILGLGLLIIDVSLETLKFSVAFMTMAILIILADKWYGEKLIIALKTKRKKDDDG